MHYSQALEYIHGAGRFSSRACLCRMEAMMEKLKPDLTGIEFIHLAGTNGKGSTAAMIESILRCAGFKVGLFTSPYLVDFCERIQINRENIPRETLAEITTLVSEAADACVAEGVERPNEFEIVTAIALVYYSREKCDFVVWETGLGGAKDATNIIPAPCAAVITSVSFDHMAQLGNTLPAIAREKLGIVKPGTGFVVLAENSDQVADVAAERCGETGTELIRCFPGEAEFTGCGLAFERKGVSYTLPLLGCFQRENAETALTVAEKLAEKGYLIPKSAMTEGLKTVSWKGRMEIISREPLAVLDCAHNVDGFEKLMAAVKTLAPEKEMAALTCMMGDKEYEKCLKMLGAGCRRVYVTHIDQLRCLDSKEIERVLEDTGCDVIAAGDVRSALKQALDSIQPDEMLLICGSVYLAGEVFSIMTE